MVIGTDYIGSCKSNYHTIETITHGYHLYNLNVSIDEINMKFTLHQVIQVHYLSNQYMGRIQNICYRQETFAMRKKFEEDKMSQLL